MQSLETTTHLKLPFQFDAEQLKKELGSFLNTAWTPHFNADGYDGKWNIIALYAEDGEGSNIFAKHDNSNLQKTEFLNNSPYFNKVIDEFKCPLLSVRLLRLGKGAYIKPHRDFKLGYEDDNFRLHIPIITNQHIDFILDDVKLEMKEGECWYTNVNYIHSVSNNGQTDRVHLVIDGARNDWSDDLFFSLAPKESFFPNKENNYSLETMKSMISELKLMETEAAKDMIETLEQKIKTSEKI